MTSDLIDQAALDRLLKVIGGSTEDLYELFEDFDQTAPQLLQKIRDAGAEKDWPAVRIAAHSLKGNAIEFGATDLALLCKTLEYQCRDEAVLDLDVQISAIQSGLDAARAALAEIKAGNA